MHDAVRKAIQFFKDHPRCGQNVRLQFSCSTRLDPRPVRRAGRQEQPGQVARVLGKSEAEIRANLGDLFQAEIGQPTPDGAIQIADRYWPYERAPTGQHAEKLPTYISQLKRAFLERRCVRSAFTAADEKIAIELYHAGVAIADVEHAILLESLRKYIALINNGRGTPITSLRYFATLFDEVKQDISPGYWVHVERRVRDAERQWGGFAVPSKSDEIRVTK